MKIGRNDPCHCGSGKKYKHCHLLNDTEVAPDQLAWRRLRRVIDDGGLRPQTLEFLVEEYGLDGLDEAWAEFLLWRNMVEDEASDDTPTDGAPDADDDLDFETEEFTSFDPESPFAEVFINWAFTFWRPDPQGTIITDETLHSIAPIDVFLRLRGQRLDPLLRQYVASLSASVVSFYQVVGERSDQCLAVRDLLLQTDHVVFDRALRESTAPGAVLLGFIASAGGVSIFHAVWPYALAPADAINIIDFREFIAETTKVTSALIRGYDIELRNMYFDALKLDAQPPSIETTDGEAVALQELDYAIESGDAAFEALHDLDVESNRDQQWQEASTTADGRLESITIQWSRLGNAQHSDWASTVLGSIHLSPSRMRIAVASNERRERIQAIVEERLGSSARLIAVSAPQTRADDLPPLNSADAERVIAEYLNKHYESWPDHPLPALNGQTPREARATPSGREKVAALLLELDNMPNPPPGQAEAVRSLRARLDLFD